MVKCKLCGEIFEESLTVCPLCGVGPDYFEPVEVEAKSGKVKCSICQAEFDATEPVCPVCNVGPEYYVPVEEAEVPMVKCDVCQAVFPADEPMCPVCCVGPEHFVPVDGQPVTAQVRCDVCHAVFSADEPVCPFCNVGPEHFVPVDQKKPAGKVRCTICKAEFDGDVENCPLCGVGAEYFEPIVPKFTGKVRCTVCQEVFDASLEKCPVCGVGPENFVQVPVQSTGKVRCDICGEVFDASLDKCPVCGVGPEHFTPVTEESEVVKRNTDQRYLILGAGTAAVNAAKAIRERDETGTITMISEEDELPYKRPQLSKHMFDGTDEAAKAEFFTLYDAQWYADRNIQLDFGQRITALNPSAKQVTMEDGTVYEYDKCIYALGSHFFVPPFQGCDQPKVKTIRTLKDIQDVNGFLTHRKQAVVIGGGVVGLEAAWDLKKNGCQVTVLEAAPALMMKNLNDTASAMLTQLLEDKGITVLTGVETERFDGETLYLKDGAQLTADVVIVSCGVRANGALAAEAGADMGKAVLVNEKMETSLPDVYGAGDCVEFGGKNYALWPEASRQGEVAGANAAGDDLTFTDEIYGMSMDVAGAGLYTIGTTAGDLPFRTVEFKDPARGNLKQYFFLDDTLCGVTLLGDTSLLGQVTEQVNGKAAYETLF